MDYIQESLIHHEQKLKFKASSVSAQQDVALARSATQRTTGMLELWSNWMYNVTARRRKGSYHHMEATIDEDDMDDTFVSPTFSGGAWLIDSASSHMVNLFSVQAATERGNKIQIGQEKC